MRWVKMLLLAGLLPVHAVVGFFIILAVGSVIFGLVDGKEFETPAGVGLPSVVVKDRHGFKLREALSEGFSSYSLWVTDEQVSDYFIKGIIAVEDRRFYSHTGIDPFAIVRAAIQNLRSGRIVSGASTITQQVVKLVQKSEISRGVRRKLWEMMGALYLERYFNKHQILTLYINYLGFGNLTRGVEAASRLYFRKPSSHLTVSEASALIAVVKAPSFLNPYKHMDRVEKRRAVVLSKMLQEGVINHKEYLHSLRNPPRFYPPRRSFFAPHFVERVVEKVSNGSGGGVSEISTTIDLGLQKKVENIVASYVRKLKGFDISNCAVIVIDNETAQVLAYVGSWSYLDRASEGMNDGVQALRNPGSTLKPFIYGFALERGHLPSEIIYDEPVEFATPHGIYRPRNYDNRYHGPVRMRVALASSFNIPAVKVVSWLGPGYVLKRLTAAGFSSLKRQPEYYGVGIALGDGEVSLVELASAYTIFARGGLWKEPVFILGMNRWDGSRVVLPPQKVKRVFSPQVSYLISDILSDSSARVPGFGEADVFDFPYQVAVKTGTSSDYRDNWTIGYSSEVTVGVWVGNFDGRPMGNVSGITGAGPIFNEVMTVAMSSADATDFKLPDGIVERRVCSLSGMIATENCPFTYVEKFIRGSEPPQRCSFHTAQFERGVHSGEVGSVKDARAFDGRLPLAIVSPADGARFVIDPELPLKHQEMKIVVGGDEISSFNGIIKLYMDGRVLKKLRGERVFYWPLKEGRHSFYVEAGGRRSQMVSVEVY